MHQFILETQRLKLIPCTVESCRASYQNRKLLSDLLEAKVPSAWPPELLDREAHEWTAAKIAANPDELFWRLWFVTLKEEAAQRELTLIGSCGFKGPADEKGIVEVGYGILEAFQRRGFATEATLKLIDWAFSDSRVTAVVAETFPALIASVGVMKKCGMEFWGDGAESGTIRYGLKKP